MSVDLFVARIDETKRLRPLMGVRLCLLVASLAFVSCVVPVDVPEPDPGDSGSDAGTSVDAGIPLDAGQGTDAGLDAGIDAGVTPLPCSVPDDLGFFVAGATRQFIFSGCATSTFSSEPGVSVVSRPNLDGSATVTITPSTLGAWGLTISTNSSTLRRDLITDEAFDLDAGFVRRYPDRIDSIRTVTPSGRVLVATNQLELAVYGLDGGLEGTIPASAWPTVWAGDVLWTLRAGTTLVERWVETPTGLVSTGTFDATGTNTCFFCRVAEQEIISVIGDDLVEFAWDGGAFSRQVLIPRLRLQDQYINGTLLVPELPEKVWATNGCSYEPGCTTMLCNSIETCPARGRDAYRIVAATQQHAFTYDALRQALQLWRLPFSAGQVLHERPGTFLLTSPSTDAPVLAGLRGFPVEAVVHRERLVYRTFAAQAGEFLVTKRWVILRASLRELRFIPR